MNIGLIDSGKGGLEFLKGIYDASNNYILIMDKAYFPYGLKTKEFLYKRTLYLCNYLISRGVDIIILACNTLSILILKDIKKKIPIVIGVFDLFSFKDNTLFIGSNNSVKYLNKMNFSIDLLDAQDLIDKIENDLCIENEIKFLNELSKNYNEVYLGCTHFIKIRSLLNEKFVSQDILFKNKIKRMKK